METNGSSGTIDIHVELADDGAQAGVWVRFNNKLLYHGPQSTDMLYERLQELCNNALRQMTNQFITPIRTRRAKARS